MALPYWVSVTAAGVALLMGSPAMAAGENLNAAAERPSVDQLVDYFDTVVFGSEMPGVKPLAHVWKWRQPLRVEVREYGEKVTVNAAGAQVRTLRQRHVKRRHFDFVQRHLNTLARLTGAKTEDVEKSRKKANLIINFVPKYQMDNPELADVGPKLLKSVAAHGGCYFLSWPDAGTRTRIVKAVIVVNADLPMARKDHCVLEELTQSLGFPNDVNTVWPSIFSDNRSVRNPARIRALSRIDKILIRTLYDARMKPGLPRVDAVAVARRVIGELDRRLP